MTLPPSPWVRTLPRQSATFGASAIHRGLSPTLASSERAAVGEGPAYHGRITKHVS